MIITKSRCKQLSALTIVLVGLILATAQEKEGPQERFSASEFGFNMSEVPPPDQQKGMPIARVFDKYLYATDVEGNSSRQKAADTVKFIWASLSERYAKAKGIEVTKNEVAQFVDSMSDEAGVGASTEALSKDERRAMRSALRELARTKVRQWKIDRKLYSRYGGAVVFQQANPIQPIGAYREFFEEMQDLGVFEILDEEIREQFWKRFTWEDATVLEQNDVDFSKPWWLQTEPTERRG